MTNTGRCETPVALLAAIAAFNDAYAVSDVNGVAPYADDRFIILMMAPSHQAISRERWLQGLDEYRLLEWDVHDESFSVYGSAANHHRKAFRRAHSRSGEAAGEICVTDSWYLHPENGWVIWHRFVTPVSG